MSIRAYYERYWTPSGFLPCGPMNSEVWELFFQHVTAQTSCIDVGCGDGRTYGWWLADRAARYVGIDISQSAIRRARERGLEAYVVEDAASLPFRDGEFDAAVCIEVLEHLFAPQDALGEINRVLGAGGMLIASVPNIAYWRRRIDLAFFGRWNPLGDDLSVAQPWRDPHLRFFTPSSFTRLLRAAGYWPVEVLGHGGAALRDLPGMRRLRSGDQGSVLYRRLQRRFPGLLAAGLVAMAVKPKVG